MKNKNLTKLGIMVMAGAVLTLGSCKKKGCTDSTATNYDEKAKKDDGSCEFAVVEDENEETVSGSITTNTTWSSDKIYILSGRVVVTGGATLTIEAGTIIKGAEGTGTNASALIIAKDGMINAVGTAASPIIFTSVLDNIEIGQTSGTNLDETDNGKWGGLIMLGEAPVSTGDGDTEGQIEGIPATEAYGAYGGSNSADNSGTLKYVSIRHGGALIGAGNEINGLTLGGVGTGTTIDHVEVVSNLDDGIEFFGGTVNLTNVVVAYQGDDGIDIDQNYAGTIDNFVVVHGINTDEGMEVDGPEGSTHTTGMFTLSNGTVKSSDGVGSGSDFKSKAQGTLTNVVWQGYTKSIKIRASYSDTVNCTLKTDAYTHLTDNPATLVIGSTNEIVTTGTAADGISVYNGTVEVSSNDICTSSIEATAEAAIGANAVTTATTGATTSVFSWTWASQHGKL